MDDFISGRTEDVHGNHTGYFYADVELRDVFAALALIGVLNSANLAKGAENCGQAARWAYEYADAMLVARETLKDRQ